jgi:hypothetical protein
VGETVGRASCPVRIAPVRAALAPLSLTPCFSGVYERPEIGINCFNSFSVDSEPPHHSGMSSAPSSRPDPAAPLAVSVQSGHYVSSHPGPLPKEREHFSTALEKSPDRDFLLRSQMVPPLPKGEGRGEGEERFGLHRHGFEFFVEGIYD